MSDMPPGLVLDPPPRAAAGMPPGLVLDPPPAAQPKPAVEEGNMLTRAWNGLLGKDVSRVGRTAYGATDPLVGAGQLATSRFNDCHQQHEHLDYQRHRYRYQPDFHNSRRFKQRPL